MGRRSGLAAAGVVLLALLLAGCARPTGDFGRADFDPLHDQLMPAMGSQRSAQSRYPVSTFNLADQEQEMRDRIWRYLVAPHAYDWFGDTSAELQRTGVMPVRSKPLRNDLYYAWLQSERFTSSRVRYNRLAADIQTDTDTMPATFYAICAVLEIERQRGVAANGLPDLEDAVAQNARARQAENRSIIEGFARAVGNRYDSYSYALDHLLVETPHEEAVEVNARISTLAVFAEAAERGDFCDARLTTGHASEDIVIPSRVLREAQDEGS